MRFPRSAESRAELSLTCRIRSSLRVKLTGPLSGPTARPRWATGSGAADGMEVDIYFTFRGIKLLDKRIHDKAKLSPLGNPAMGMRNWTFRDSEDGVGLR